jgi:hypothetical protein
MESRRRILSAMLAALGGAACARAGAAAPARNGVLVPVQAPPAGAPPPDPLFAVELRTGPRWDPAKPAHEQAYFRVFYSGCVGATPAAPRRQSEAIDPDVVAEAGARR